LIPENTTNNWELPRQFWYAARPLLVSVTGKQEDFPHFLLYF